MKTIKDFINLRSVSRVLVVFCAGIFLLVTTACSANPPAPNVSGTGSYTEHRGAQTELYAPIQKRKGGMNQYDDVEPTVNTRQTDAKAKQLVDRARANTQKAIQSPEDYARNYRQGAPLNERVENIVDSVKESTEEVTEGVAKGTERGTRNLRNNTSDAAKDVSKAADRATDKAANYVNDRV